jgi:hypothetical protein
MRDIGGPRRDAAEAVGIAAFLTQFLIYDIFSNAPLQETRERHVQPAFNQSAPEQRIMPRARFAGQNLPNTGCTCL